MHSRFMMLLWISMYVVLLIFCMDLQLLYSIITPANESDKLALLSFKSKITQDPLQVLSSWNDSTHFCEWTGITCTRSSHQRVVMLRLVSKKLVGSLSPSIGNLTFLTGINLRDNGFHGEIPQEFGRLLHLQHLNLTSNSFEGKIPSNLSYCLGLKSLDVVYNDLVGEIPDQLSYLTSLVYLGVGGNNLTGTIPPWVGNFSSLFAISLAQNSFHGDIPNDLGRLSRLGFFQIYDNLLSGTVPYSIFNISSIYYLSVTMNQLHGHLLPDLGSTLPKLEVFAGGVNNFTGPIPISLSNLTSLQILDFEQNSLTGPLPVKIGNIRGLKRFNFGSNQLGAGEASDLDFLISLDNCTVLEVLGLDGNRLEGELLVSLANLSTQLQILTIGRNLIKGSIPMGIENLVKLTSLGLEGNFITGRIPTSVGKLQLLRKLNLNVNMFSGPIPSSLGNLTLLYSLFMEENALEGSIPSSLGNCQNLIVLNLSHNHLNGTIPKQVISLSSLSISFSASHNSLSGSLPLEVGSLKNLGELQVSDNELSGKIPSTLANCQRLERLRLEGNHFQGTIPESLSALRGIQEMDLSHNNLSGPIPQFPMKLPFLNHLNLSFNDFSGEVPKQGIFTNASAISLLGNTKLCSDIVELELPACSKQAPPFLSGRKIALITLGILLLALLSIFGALYYMGYLRRRSNDASKSSSGKWQSRVSHLELFKSTDGFSSENLLGVGSFGSVYKGVLCEDGEVVAIKVLNLQEQGASKSFIAECEALRNIRHRNLVKIITACSTVDSQGNDFKALIMEFMPNGSLEQWLHPNVEGRQKVVSRLSLSSRISIAIDVASALEYLHHDCHTPIAHCDLKPSNVLLDEDMTAHVGDFGLAKFLCETNGNSSTQTMSAGLKGSIGYIPPEYGMGGQVSILGDVYSYGVLLLEMFTGKRPTDDMFKDGLSLYEWVMMALPDGVTQIVDPLLLSEPAQDEEENYEARAIINYEISRDSVASRLQECLVSVITIGVSCCKPTPGDRMLMKDSVSKLHAVRRSYPEFLKLKQMENKM